MSLSPGMPPSQFDTEPELRRCECGREHRWTWYAPRGHAPRWCSPKVNPCEFCARSPEAQHGDLIVRRLLAANVPNHALHVRLDRDNLASQLGGETDEAFLERARRERKLGILAVNVEPLRLLYRFLATRDPLRNLLVTGPPGTGKTTWLGGLARRLLESSADEWREAEGRTGPGARTLVRRRAHEVEYHTVPELLARERLKIKGLDPHPMQDVAKARVLLLDELGVPVKVTKTEAEMVERIVMYRAEKNLPTVIATNLERSALQADRDPPYGTRVASRLHAYAHVPLGGPDWRAA